MTQIKDKIKKLLSLAQSPNENEARDALLKAKELMIKNKLTEEDFEKEEDKLVHEVCDDIKWTTDSGDVWMTNLCKVIADNYLCAVAWQTPRATRTHTLVITGFESDVNICKEVIEYAVGFIYGHTNKKSRGSYAKGFVLGLELAFEIQKEEHPEWALVVVEPDEVNEYENNLSSKNVRTKKFDFDPIAYAKGQNAGMNFNAKSILTVAN